jgi:putative membrane-bound dehydrogenase-like protein
MKCRLLLSLFVLLSAPQSRPAGRQLTGQHAPATTPALSPVEAQKKFTVPEGFEVRLFAAEPDVINPVAMTWDERGRLWVLELFEYPLGAPAGIKPRDNIKILEDTDADGRADKVTVFADRLNLGTGLLLGDGGAYVGQAPHLLFLEDTDGDDRADKRTILKTGFGLEDRHELLNGFTWGPDGWLYMTHGVFTNSKVKDPSNPDDDGVLMTAAVARYHPRTKKFEVFAEGTSNPWGVDFDRYGNAFVSACVIDHLFHMAPGGIYARQAGTAPHKFAYVDDLPGRGLPSIVDHKHFRAAYAGVQVYQGDQYPEEYRGTILMGNIHDSAVHQDRLTPNGSSFRSSFEKDFVRANDGWFRPVSSQIGPDGALWMMDWYDKYPCYQNANADPEGVDRTHGRIWRVVFSGSKAGSPIPSRPAREMDLKKLTSADLVKALEHRNVWQRRSAQRLLSERRDRNVKPALENLLKSGRDLESRLAGLWTLHGAELLDEATLDRCASDRDPAIRAWAARLSGERQIGAEPVLHRLVQLARDPDPVVRVAVATAARQFASGSLTVNAPPSPGVAGVDLGEMLAALMESSRDGRDPLIPHMIWMAAEPAVPGRAEEALGWLLENGKATMPLSGEITRKIMRRICDIRSREQLDQAVRFLEAAIDRDPALTAAALDGLIEGQRGSVIIPQMETRPVLTKLAASGSEAVASRAQRLGALWGDAASLSSLLAKAIDPAASDDDRIKSIQVARQMKNDSAREAMLKVLSMRGPDRVTVEAIRALSELGGDSTGEELLKHWKTLSPGARRAAAESLASRRRWALPFLGQIEQNVISRSDLPATVIRSLLRSNDDYVKNRAVAVIGKFRETDADKQKLIAAKRQVVLNGPVDLKGGLEVTRKTCLTCHKLHGEGADVGPDLTGVGRSTLDALLANVIDPNQIIGLGYENVEIETKDGRVVSGRVVEQNDTRVKLASAGPKEEVIARGDIASLRVSEMSVMPEGLEQMPDEDFRNMIWYILNPPQDNRPLTPELRRELIGDDRQASVTPAPLLDRESVSLWNPEWRVLAPEFEHSPAKLADYAGRKNVLMTHPVDENKGAALERVIEIPDGRPASLSLAVAAHEQGDWELRVLADGKVLHKQIVDRKGERWKAVNVDLSSLAGRKTVLRLENCANNWEWEFGYWSDVQIKVAAR